MSRDFNSQAQGVKPTCKLGYGQRVFKGMGWNHLGSAQSC